MSPNMETAIKQLLSVTVGRAAEEPVLAATKQQIAQNLSNAKVSYYPDVNWRTTFFPNQTATNLSNLVPEYTKLGESFWVNYATLIMCQSIYYWSPVYGSRINIQMVNDQMNVQSSKAFVYTGYLGITAVAENTQVMTLASVAKSAGATKADLAAEIIKIIPSRILLYQDKNWPNGDLEIFDWLGKFLAMGGMVGEVPALLAQWYSVGLPEFPNMSGTSFEQYKGYMTRSQGPSYSDFPELQPIITYSETNCYQVCVDLKDIKTGWYINNAATAVPYLAPSSCCSGDTEILMADGSTKLISQIKPGDVVLGPAGPVKPLYISKTPLSGRQLYELFAPGEGPRLTSAHPIVNADPSTKAAAVVAISPYILRQILPNNSRTGVGPALAGETRVWVTNTVAKKKYNEPVTETIKAVRETDTSRHRDAVYDIVLPFSETQQNGYWAGRKGKFVLIEPELIRLEDHPYVAAALFTLLEGLAQAYEKGEWSIKKDDSEYYLRNYLKFYGEQLVDLSLQTALCNTSTKEEPSVVPDMAELGQLIDAFVHQGWTASPSLIADIAMLLETFSKNIYVPLGNIIRTGWRYFPREELRKEMNPGQKNDPNRRYFVVTLMDIEFDNGLSVANSTTIMINTQITTSDVSNRYNVEDTFTTRNSTNKNTFRQVIDHVLVYEKKGEEDQPTLKTGIFLSPKGPSWAESEAIPIHNNTYSHGQLMLFDRHGIEVGKVHYDVRRLNAEQLHSGAQLEPSWGERAQMAYAVSLGRAMVPSVAQALSQSHIVMKKKPLHFLMV